jgi:hypothetical protein
MHDLLLRLMSFCLNSQNSRFLPVFLSHDKILADENNFGVWLAGVGS